MELPSYNGDYIGCFSASFLNTDKGNLTDNSISKCIEYCSGKSSKFAALKKE